MALSVLINVLSISKSIISVGDIIVGSGSIVFNGTTDSGYYQSQDNLKVDSVSTDANGYPLVNLSTIPVTPVVPGPTEQIPVTPIQPTSGGGGTHTHTLSWKIVIEPTEISDGRCEYSCECGHVEAAQPISFFGAIIKRIIKEIQEAPENGTVTVENQFLRCLTDEIIDALHKRSDVSLEIIFKEEEETYQCLIPAGKAPTDGGEWYGYFYLGSLYGWK